MGGKIDWGFKLVDGAKYTSDHVMEQYIRRAWKSSLTVLGIENMPNS